MATNPDAANTGINAANYSNTRELGLLLYTEYLYPVEVAAVILLGATAGADFIWQKMRFAKRMRMTKEELKEDYKQTEGDPHVKAKLKQIRMQRSRQRMMANVPKATVIVTNPTHYSVALRYEPDQGGGAPVCVAKGVDEIAAKIRAAGVDIKRLSSSAGR